MQGGRETPLGFDTSLLFAGPAGWLIYDFGSRTTKISNVSSGLISTLSHSVIGTDLPSCQAGGGRLGGWGPWAWGWRGGGWSSALTPDPRGPGGRGRSG